MKHTTHMTHVKQRANSTKVPGTVRWMSSILMFSLLFFILLTGLSYGQKRFMMNEEEVPKFRLAKQLYHRAEQLFKQQKFQASEALFQKCYDTFPRFSHADYYLAQIHYGKRDYSRAMTHIQRAMKNYEFLATLGVNTQLQYIDSLRTTRQSERNNVWESNHKLKRKAYRGGKALSEKAGEYTDGNEIEGLRNSLQIQSQMNQSQLTINDADQRLNMLPVAGEAHTPTQYFFLYGNILYKVKRYRDALKQYQEAVNVAPDNYKALHNIANLYFMARKYKKALEYLDKAEKAGSKANPNFRAKLQTLQAQEQKKQKK